MRRTTGAALRRIHPPTGPWIARQQARHAEPQVRQSGEPAASFVYRLSERHEGPPSPAHRCRTLTQQDRRESYGWLSSQMPVRAMTEHMF